MKPIYIFKSFTSIFFLIVLSISFQGCVGDSLSECGVNINFTYTKNVDDEDKYLEEVERISVFVFDESNLFVGRYTQDNTNRLDINILPGIYHFIAWGNLCDDYTLSSLVSGESSMDDAVLALTRSSDTITHYPVHLFYGALLDVEVKDKLSFDQPLTLDLMKNTNTIKVTAIGLPVTRSSGDFVCEINSVNGDYKFENNDIASDERLHYRQDSEFDNNSNLVSDFVIMREKNDGSTESRLMIKDTESAQDLFNENLTDLLLPASVTNDLDIDSNFDIEVEFTAGRVVVTVNGWVVQDSGRPL